MYSEPDQEVRRDDLPNRPRRRLLEVSRPQGVPVEVGARRLQGAAPAGEIVDVAEEVDVEIEPRLRLPRSSLRVVRHLVEDAFPEPGGLQGVWSHPVERVNPRHLDHLRERAKI